MHRPCVPTCQSFIPLFISPGNSLIPVITLIKTLYPFCSSVKTKIDVVKIVSPNKAPSSSNNPSNISNCFDFITLKAETYFVSHVCTQKNKRKSARQAHRSSEFTEAILTQMAREQSELQFHEFRVSV